MSNVECIHGAFSAATCPICKNGPKSDMSQMDLRLGSIAKAVAELSGSGTFTTLQIARHSAVQSAHPKVRQHPQFNQHIGMYLTSSWGTLGIEQVSAKGISNATWRKRT
jgi:hypothetical protein